MSKTYCSKNYPNSQRRMERAFDLALHSLQVNPNFPIECWISGLDEPYRSQVWQRAKEVVAHEQLELKLE